MSKLNLILFVSIFAACTKHVVDEQKVVTAYKRVPAQLLLAYDYYNRKGDKATEADFAEANRRIEKVLIDNYHSDVVNQIKKNGRSHSTFDCGPFAPHACAYRPTKFEVVEVSGKSACLHVFDPTEDWTEVFMHFTFENGDYRYTHAVQTAGFSNDSKESVLYDPRKDPDEQVKLYPVSGCVFDIS